MKKSFLVVICVLFLGGLFVPKISVEATEFAGREDEYTTMCQDTSSLSKSDIQVCSEFSDYLRNKNSSIEDNIAKTQEDLDSTLSDLSATQSQLAQTQQQIASVESELAVLEGRIKQLNKDIEDKKTRLRDRMYVLQSYVNGNELVNLLFSSGNLDELLTRIQCVDELTNYDKELITGLARDKQEVEIKTQEKTAQFDNLFALQSQQTALMLSLNDKVSDYQSTIDNQNALLNNYRDEIGYIDSSLSEAEKRLKAEEERKKAEEEAKKEENNKPSNNKPSKPNQPEQPSEPSNPDNSSIGSAIVSTALSKNGSPYVYGGTGPDVFDCSGFVQWVYKQNGIYIPRTVSPQYYGSDRISSPEPGDLVFFNTYEFLGHVGIYIGNGQFIHAGTSSTGVYIADFYSSYWQGCYQGAGRFR